MTLLDLIPNFFTHKDFLPPADQIPGTMFTPLHFAFSAVCIALVLFLSLSTAKKSEKTIRTVFGILWAGMAVWEIVKILWESYAGATVRFELDGILPLYPCSIFLYAMPFAIWGKGWVRKAACGYVCSLGLLGGAINFVYPATILGTYSCISFAGFHTFFYHGILVFCAITMLRSGYHSYRGITKAWQLLVPSVPFLVVSLAANAVNFSPINADYMFFKLQSFIFAPIGAALPTGVCVVIVYFSFLLIHALPLLPSYIANRRKAKSLV